MELKDSIKKLASQCVKCGVCAPHCPTYVKTQQEGESARGRIALMEALANEQLSSTPTLLAHLDSCLYCRSCEAVCPSEVSYAELLNATHRLIAPVHPLPKFVDFIFRSPQRLRFIASLLWCYQHLFKTSSIPKKRRGIARYLHYLPPITLKRWRTHYPVPHTASKGRPAVKLFLGCMTPLTQAPVIQAAIQLLHACDYAVTIPAKQTCCGAFHLHRGADYFARFAKDNIRYFSNNLPILFLTPGCGMILKDYPRSLPYFSSLTSKQNQLSFAQQVTDIFSFLAQHHSKLHFRTCTLKVALHTPCSVKNVLKTEEALHSLLRQIPDLNIIPLEGSTRCCGAAGLNMLTQPKMADSLAEDLIEKIEKIQPDVVLTSNIGCQLHLEAQLRLKGITVPLQHPLQLLAKQLNTK
ncbi:MAG: (Fe-S)-binding protein [Gammaproteobacteria bacterium]|nr:(Fe-S)-binding protein [Gammaproteobacteria bacterium]